MINRNPPRKGSLLLSEPFMLDPNFKRAVVLLCEHSEEGSMGLVLNQISELSLSEVIDAFPGGEQFRLFIGGPVEQDSIQFVHKCYDKLQSGVEVGEGIYWGGNFETLKVLIEQGAVHPGEIKFFLGYSGWISGQLQHELAENTWMVCNTYNPELVFVENGDSLWKEAIVALGPKYAHVARFPENPMWN